MRIVTLVAAGLIGLFSLGLLAGGAALLWGESQKDEQGYLSTSRERFATNGYALTTESLDVDATWLLDRDRYGEIRIEAPYPRDERFRTSETYNRHCREVSATLHRAMAR